MCFFITSCGNNISQPENCPASFNTYAYGSGQRNLSEISIPNNWQLIDKTHIEISEYSWLKIALIRKVKNDIEIWLKEPDSNFYSKSESEHYKYYIYSVEKKELWTVSAVVPNTGAFAMKLFLSKDGIIWAQNFWDTNNSAGNSSDRQNYPVLSRFNDVKQQFELVPQTQGIDAFKGLAWNKIIYLNNIFWIFAQRDSIYSFDPTTSQVEKHLGISDIEIQYIASSQDGKSIFIQVAGDEMSFSVTEGEYLQYVIDENRLLNLSIPSNEWPASGSILVDQSGNLWLSAVGWRTPDGKWRLLYPTPIHFFCAMQVEGGYDLELPKITFESSDGRLWFNSDKGMAWLDPVSMQGCWFTSIGASNVMEDLDRNLWMIADGKLYKLPLEK